MRRHIKTLLLISGAIIIAGCLVVVGLRVFTQYLRARVESVIQSAELVHADLPAVIPFRQVNQWMIVKAAVNGSEHEYEFIVDTGAEATCLLRTAFENLQVAPVSVGGITLGGASESVVLLDSLSLPGVTYERVGALAVDEELLEPISCLVDGGIIGINVLSRATLEIDHAARILFVSGASERRAADESVIDIPLVREPHRGLAFLNLSMSNGDTIPLLLDTGYAGSIKITVPDVAGFFDRLSIGAARRCWAGPPVGSRQAEQLVPKEHWIVRIDGSSVGWLDVGMLPITVERDDGEGPRGLLGNRFLGHYRVGIDWAANRCRLKPRDHQHLPRDTDVLGLTYRPYEGKLIVDTVYEHSEANEAGITPGNEIIAIEGHRIADLIVADICRLWPDEPIFGNRDADSLTITVQHGDTEKTHRLSRFPLLGS